MEKEEVEEGKGWCWIKGGGCSGRCRCGLFLASGEGEGMDIGCGYGCRAAGREGGRKQRRRVCIGNRFVCMVMVLEKGQETMSNSVRWTWPLFFFFAAGTNTAQHWDW